MFVVYWLWEGDCSTVMCEVVCCIDLVKGIAPFLLTVLCASVIVHYARISWESIYSSFSNPANRWTKVLLLLFSTDNWIHVCFRLNSNVCMVVEFCREVTDMQMPQVASVILPEMYKIFTQQNVSHFPVFSIILSEVFCFCCVSPETTLTEEQ